jgi:hypothetical protein
MVGWGLGGGGVRMMCDPKRRGDADSRVVKYNQVKDTIRTTKERWVQGCRHGWVPHARCSRGVHMWAWVGVWRQDIWVAVVYASMLVRWAPDQ